MSQGVRPEAAVSQGVRPEAAASQGGHGTTLCRTVVPTPPGQLIRASEIRDYKRGAPTSFSRVFRILEKKTGRLAV